MMNSNATNFNSIDHYGFQNTITPDKSDNKKIDQTAKLKRENARMEKWRTMLLTPSQFETAATNKIIKRRIRKGIPECLRFKVWPLLAKIDSIRKKSHVPYQTLINSDHAPALSEIILDIKRTFPTHQLFTEETGQNSLRNVLKALSITHPRMGYCQGLNFVAGLFLIYMNDEDTYWILVSIMQNYHMEQYYADINALQKPLFIIDRLVKKLLPKVAKIMETIGISAIIYAPAWIIGMFITTLPFNLVVRIMDIYLNEGMKMLYRVVLAILKLKEKEILKCEKIDQLMLCLKDFTGSIWKDENMLIKTALGIKLTQKNIQVLNSSIFIPHTFSNIRQLKLNGLHQKSHNHHILKISIASLLCLPLSPFYFNLILTYLSTLLHTFSCLKFIF